jgi:sirohydrochlorin cobaltochelatase
MTTALVLAGHGSHISPNTAGIVWALVDELRALRIADEVTATFWKETPSFHAVFDTLSADDITIVPLFTARGYFTQTVIPAEMGLTGTLTKRGGRTLRYTRTLGEHPRLAQIVRQRVEQTLAQFEISPSQAAVALIGHGTKRSSESRDATNAQAEMMRDSGMVAEAVAVFLDDEPNIPQAYRLTSAPNLIAVPYFLATGSHTTIDLPAELGLKPGQANGEVEGRNVYYTLPVGAEDSLADLALELAHDAGAPLCETGSGSEWDCFPTIGRDALVGEVLAAGKMQFGQLTLTPSAVHVTGDTEQTAAFDSPSALRAWIREQPFRPLSTTCDLPGGWRVEIRELSMLHAVVETVYPGAVADWAAQHSRTFHPSSLAEVTARQTGMLRALTTMSHDQQAEMVAQVCGNCARHATWFYGSSPAATIPCAEPCNYWMSRAWEQKR